MRNLDDVRNLFPKTLDHLGKLTFCQQCGGKHLWLTADYDQPSEGQACSITRGVYRPSRYGRLQQNNGKLLNLSTSSTAMAIPESGAYSGCKAAIEQI